MSLSLDDLDSHRFNCADIIRDAVDSTDDTDSILPLVYDTSISDEFAVQHEPVLEEYGEPFARRETLYDVPIVPEGYLWSDIRATYTPLSSPRSTNASRHCGRHSEFVE
jgi:type I restriction enzyme M protein